jgi:hypothetical protein
MQNLQSDILEHPAANRQRTRNVAKPRLAGTKVLSVRAIFGIVEIALKGILNTHCRDLGRNRATVVHLSASSQPVIERGLAHHMHLP